MGQERRLMFQQSTFFFWAAWPNTSDGKSKCHTLLCGLVNWLPLSEPQFPYLKNNGLLCRWWLKSLTWCLSCCVILEMKISFSEPQLLHLQSGVN